MGATNNLLQQILNEYHYENILAKVSGDYFNDITKLSETIESCKNFDSAIIMCGGGNIIRGKNNHQYIGRSYADSIGMLSTEINGLSLLGIFDSLGIAAKLFCSNGNSQYANRYSIRACKESIYDNAVILTSGLGCGYISTDTALVVRALELDCIPIKVTVVGGIFSEDPKQNPNASMYHSLSYNDALEKNLIDKSAIAIAKEHNVPLIVTDLSGYISLLSDNPQQIKCTVIS